MLHGQPTMASAKSPRASRCWTCPATMACPCNKVAEAVRGLERAKWRLWHGRWPGCRRKLAALCRWARRTSIHGMAGIGRLEHHVSELLAYLERNRGALVHYAARHRNGEPISTAFVESAVNEIIAKRMNKKQQMRWNRATVSPSSTYEQRC
jgi:hypothetical protein